ncbi:MAG: hypothetical protein SFY67_16505 [Candidatus Melainabacteria bacterium]|nr:hypothetical protein [Candidatus Melainabacteria bacterium]
MMRKFFMLVASCLFISSVPVPCFAAPVLYNTPVKQGKMPFWGLPLFILAEGFCKENPDHFCIVQSSLTSEDLEKIAKKRPDSLDIEKGADASLLTNIDSFKHVTKFWLKDEYNNTAHLRNLKSYHPKFVYLFQLKPLSDEALVALGSIDTEDLHIVNGVANPDVFGSNPPKNLKKLTIGITISFLNLPDLKTLTLMRMKVGAKILKNIKAPKLKELNLISVDLEDGCAEELTRIRNLQKLCLAETSISPSDFAKLRKKMGSKLECRNVRIVSQGD